MEILYVVAIIAIAGFTIYWFCGKVDDAVESDTADLTINKVNCWLSEGITEDDMDRTDSVLASIKKRAAAKAAP